MTRAWEAVVPPNHILLIGLLALFEGTVGVLAPSGGCRTQYAYAGVIAFYLALWPFGWFETTWVLVMLPPMLVLLQAERHARAHGVEHRHTATGGSVADVHHGVRPHHQAG